LPVEEGPEMQEQILCQTLQSIRDDCMMDNMKACYRGHDLTAHMAFLEETLKISSTVLAVHLANITDVTICPVFQDSALGYGGKTSVVALALFASAAALALVAVTAVLAAKLRLAPRLRAWAASRPYGRQEESANVVNNEVVSSSANERAMERRSSEREREDRRREDQA